MAHTHTPHTPIHTDTTYTTHTHTTPTHTYHTNTTHIHHTHHIYTAYVHPIHMWGPCFRGGWSQSGLVNYTRHTLTPTAGPTPPYGYVLWGVVGTWGRRGSVRVPEDHGQLPAGDSDETHVYLHRYQTCLSTHSCVCVSHTGAPRPKHVGLPCPTTPEQTHRCLPTPTVGRVPTPTRTTHTRMITHSDTQR